MLCVEMTTTAERRRWRWCRIAHRLTLCCSCCCRKFHFSSDYRRLWKFTPKKFPSETLLLKWLTIICAEQAFLHDHKFAFKINYIFSFAVAISACRASENFTQRRETRRDSHGGRDEISAAAATLHSRWLPLSWREIFPSDSVIVVIVAALSQFLPLQRRSLGSTKSRQHFKFACKSSQHDAALDRRLKREMC